MKVKALKYLLIIPVILLLDLLILAGAAMLDVQILPAADEQTVGHGAPVFTILSFLPIAVITGAGVLVSVALTLWHMFKG